MYSVVENSAKRHLEHVYLPNESGWVRLEQVYGALTIDSDCLEFLEQHFEAKRSNTT